MIIRQTLRASAAALAPVSETPRLDAELLMAHALGLSREQLLLRHLGDGEPAAFAPLLARRQRHEPVAYIVGHRAFWTIEIEVGPGVLIPRPDTETLIEAAVAYFGRSGPARVLDLGTGPGTLLLAALAEWPGATGLGIDASPRALGYAERNARRLCLEDRAAFRAGDWTSGVSERFDLVLCNPPYVETDAALGAGVRDWEPHEALFAGADGLDDYRRLAPALPALLAAEGLACVEIGVAQAERAGILFATAGLEVALRHDLCGRPRCLVLSHDGHAV